MPAAIAPIAGAVVGGMMSKKGGEQTASKEPWSEAAPWLKENLKTGQALQEYYQQNPFSPQQQTAYQNLFSSADNYRDSVAPGLLAITNKYLQGGGSPGVSLLTSGQTAKSGAPTKGFGLLDFQQLNPFTATNGIPSKPTAQPEQQAQKTPEDLAREEWERLRLSGMGYQGAGE